MVLVSIVRNFDSSVLPIFYEFKDVITKHILLFDNFKNDVEKANQLRHGIEKFKNSYGYSFDCLKYIVDEDSMKDIVKFTDYLLLQEENHNEIYVNITDGSSTLTAIINNKLIDNGVNFISYDMYANEYNLLHKDSLQKHPIKSQMSIKEHFILKGSKIEQSNIKTFANNYEQQIKNIFENLSDEYDKYLQIKADNILIKQLPNKFKKIKKLFISMDLGELHIKNSTVTGSLFESYVYNLLKRLDYDDMEVGIKVKREYKTTNIENEFDILLMKNNHLHMIECKYRNSINLEHLIYKYIALSDIIDDEGKMIIASKKAQNYDENIDKDRNAGRVQKRGKLSNIEVVGGVHKNPDKFISFVKSYLHV